MMLHAELWRDGKAGGAWEVLNECLVGRGEIVRPVQLITEIDGRNPMQGATVANLSPQLADDFGIGRTSGVVVTDVAGRSLAARFGFEPGDVVVGVNGRKITDVGALQQVLQRGSRVWNIAVDRNGSTLTLSVRN